MDNNHNLVIRSQAGDREAFGELAEKHAGLIVAFVASITGSRDNAEDIAQEVFVKAFTSIKKLRDPLKFRSWLCGIASNLSKDWLREKKRAAKEKPLNEAGEPALQADDEKPGSPERSEELWKNIAALPEDQRRAIALKYTENLSYQEISEEMGVPASTVRGLLFRATQNLRKNILKET